MRETTEQVVYQKKSGFGICSNYTIAWIKLNVNYIIPNW